MMRLRAFRKDPNDGAAAVEFAMLLPVMITLFFGVVETTAGAGVPRRCFADGRRPPPT